MSSNHHPAHLAVLREADVTARPFTLDTDIGTDVDDLLAIAMAFASPELHVDAITTVYGDVALRARIAAKAYASAGRAAPSIAPGLDQTRSGREVWWPGHEGSTIDDLDSQAFATARDAVDELAAASTIAAIAPLTNVAAAVERPQHGIREIVMMGGAFGDDRIEHNIRCDIAAADAVFRSGVELTVIGLEQTERVRLEATDLHTMAASGQFGAMLDAEVRRFRAFTGDPFNIPHDPLALLILIAPELFTFARGRITVETEGDDAGRTHFTPDEHGPHRIVTDYDTRAAHDEIVGRILTACTTPTAILDEEETP
jgi:purine nucleosidase